MTVMEWPLIQEAIRTCRLCEGQAVRHLHVPCSEKRRPPWEPLRPVRLYLVSVAPPWGGAYFWDETERDAVREGVFRALRRPLGVSVGSCRDFRDLRLFLTPAVKCPSSMNDNDHQPSWAAVRNCVPFLKSELVSADAERILALGRVPFRALCEAFRIDAPTEVAEFRREVVWVRLGSRTVPLSGTYFAGNNRHRGFSAIVDDIDRLLALSPRDDDA